MGIPAGKPCRLATEVVKTMAGRGADLELMTRALEAVVADPAAHLDDPILRNLAEALTDRDWVERSEPAPFEKWGSNLDEQSIQQIRNGCALPIAVRGALMPDAHVGYGLPIGGVLATDNAVIPYAVGVDIACRMKLSIYDIPVKRLLRDKGKGSFTNALNEETKFGVGGFFREKREHAVLDQDWSVTRITRDLKPRAWAQLGTSGSGNHFAEFGEIQITDTSLGIEPGTYVALMSHSGSRGAGAAVAAHYSKLAREAHPKLPKELQRLAWLGMNSEEGQEYWAAMELMGDYAAANHACIHDHVAKSLGLEAILSVENHHNFAWKETHGGKEVIVHRKGATPAGDGVLGVIPGSMASPAYLVRGKGNPLSLNSASHGAGRVMSRSQAAKRFNWKDVNRLLSDRGVHLLSAGLDEVPLVYKDIDTVMSDQTDLVESLGRFFPRLVKMAPAGERPED